MDQIIINIPENQNISYDLLKLLNSLEKDQVTEIFKHYMTHSFNLKNLSSITTVDIDDCNSLNRYIAEKYNVQYNQYNTFPLSPEFVKAKDEFLMSKEYQDLELQKLFKRLFEEYGKKLIKEHIENDEDFRKEIEKYFEIVKDLVPEIVQKIVVESLSRTISEVFNLENARKYSQGIIDSRFSGR